MRMKLIPIIPLFLFLSEHIAATEYLQCKDKTGAMMITDNKFNCSSNPKQIGLHRESRTTENQAKNLKIISTYDHTPKGFDSNKFSELLQMAANSWGVFIDSSAKLEILITFVDNSSHMMQMNSITSVFSHKKYGTRYFHQGITGELISGIDPNGSEPDALLRIDRSAISNMNLWLESNLQDRSGNIPINQIDTLSILMHELGHALCFNGFIDMKSQRSALQNHDLSTYDALVTFIDKKPFLHGPLSSLKYGNAIPLNQIDGTYSHLAIYNPETSPIMSEESIKWGKKYFITNIDLAILNDCGIKLKPEI